MRKTVAHRGVAARIAVYVGIALTGLRRVVDVSAILLLTAMIVLIALQILGRYVFNYSISWTEEAAMFAQVWLVMLGAGIAMRHQNHVGVDVVIALFPPIIQRIAKAGSFILGAWLLLVIIVGSFSMIALGMGVKSAALQIPLAVPFAALPVGMGYFLLEFGIATWPEVRHPASTTSLAHGEEI